MMEHGIAISELVLPATETIINVPSSLPTESPCHSPSFKRENDKTIGICRTTETAGLLSPQYCATTGAPISGWPLHPEVYGPMDLYIKCIRMWQRLRSLSTAILQKGFEGRTPPAENTTRRETPSLQDSKRFRKGDPTLLEGKESVTFRTAELYLGISERHRQKLMQKGVLQVVGHGHNRRIMTDSLRRYLPPTKSEPTRTDPH